MSAPDHAEPIAPDNKDDEGKTMGHFTCEGCGYHGKIGELLGVDPDDDSTLWCPNCTCSGIVFDGD